MSRTSYNISRYQACGILSHLADSKLLHSEDALTQEQIPKIIWPYNPYEIQQAFQMIQEDLDLAQQVEYWREAQSLPPLPSCVIKR